MEYTVECRLHDFPFWAGAKDRVEYLTIGELDQLENLIADLFCDRLPSETEINDIFWFEEDLIANFLGYNSFDEIMKRTNE